jgi:hypothetical protein
MRDETLRIRTYKYKTEGSTWKLRTDAMAQQQKKGYKSAADSQAKVAMEIKRLLGGAVPSMMQVYYINFANELLMKARKHAGETLCNEIGILFEKHKARGENEVLLRNIIALYAPICMPTVIEYFKLDISLLDGPDVLA